MTRADLFRQIPIEEYVMPRKRKMHSQSGAALTVMQPDAAGIDVGATEMYVAVPEDRDPQPVRCFATFTPDLQALADWLQHCRIRTVAMESTGVYWIPLFQILKDRGLEVCLVNARHVQNVAGRRTDVSDCRWLQYLHAVGLLRASFRPPQEVCALRSLLRHRDNLIKQASVHILHMQKALDQMNLRLHHVIDDITGMTGLAIVDAILAGQRDPAELAKLRHPGIKASEETIIKSLIGDYRNEHLLVLRQSLAAYRYFQRLIRQCDLEIQRTLKGFDSRVDLKLNPIPKDRSGKTKPRRNEPQFNLREHLYRILGVDLTQVPGLQATTVHTLLAEIGPSASKFRSASAFASWMGLCPHNDISGGKILMARTRKVNNRAATALRMAAQSLHGSQSYLGEFYRRMRARLGAPKANVAAAHKLARIIFHLLTTRQPYDESVFARQEIQFRKRAEGRLKKQAQALGFHLVAADPRTEVP